MSEANTTEVADTVHNNTLVLDQHTSGNFLTSSDQNIEHDHIRQLVGRVLNVWVARKRMCMLH